jgi:chromate transporter
MKIWNKKYFRDLWDLYLVFFKIGAVTFGGGLAMLPILEEELSIKRKWTNQEQLLDYFAIGQVTPGIIAVNVSTFIGYNRCGIIGGIVGTLGVITPSIIIITILALFISNFSQIPIVKKALAGINIAVAALLTKVVITFAKNAIQSFFTVLLMITSFVLVSFFKVSTIWVILAGIGTGICIHLHAQKVAKKMSSIGEDKNSKKIRK